MAPKQKGVKMALSDFLKDESLGGGSWADDDVDFNNISVPTTKHFGQTGIPTGGANARDPAFGDSAGGPKRDFQEFPVPNAPPYRARMNNLPWDATEDSIAEWVESSLASSEGIEHISAPRDMNDSSRLRGFAFITLTSREHLVELLKFSGSDMFGRRVYVAVAAPDKGGFGSSRRDEEIDLDWGSARGSGHLPPPRDDFGSDRPRREPREPRDEPNLDWGSARGTGELPPPREDFGRERRPRREEPDLDWGVSRGSANLPPRDDSRDEFRERKPKREEPNLDWGSARGTGSLPEREHRPEREFKEREQRPEREFKERTPKKEEAEFDWSAARGSGHLPAREFKERKPKREEPVLDWTRGQTLPPRSAHKPAQKPVQKPVQKDATVSNSAVQKSAFAVLGDDDDEEDKTETADLVAKTEKLDV